MTKTSDFQDTVLIDVVTESEILTYIKYKIVVIQLLHLHFGNSENKGALMPCC